MTKRPRLWTAEETTRARAMLARNAAEREFIAAFGKSKGAAESRIKWVDMDQAQRDHNRQRVNTYRCLGGSPEAHSRMVVPQEVLIERERRLAAPQPAAAALLGDPRPGQSALDKARAAHG